MLKFEKQKRGQVEDNSPGLVPCKLGDSAEEFHRQLWLPIKAAEEENPSITKNPFLLSNPAAANKQGGC